MSLVSFASNDIPFLSSALPFSKKHYPLSKQEILQLPSLFFLLSHSPGNIKLTKLPFSLFPILHIDDN
jgi:hypothetical protein